MVFQFLADVIVVVHFAFVLFVVLGGLLVLPWPAVRWVHLPAAAWGVWIEFTGRICPLTPLENALRLRGGEAAYSGDFVSRYVLPVLYPAGLTRPVQLFLGLIVIAVNVAVYAVLWARARKVAAYRGSEAAPTSVPRSRPARTSQ
jgi:hypothetical protein